MKTKTLIPFLLITFGLTWGLALLLMLFYDPIVALFGEVTPGNPLFILAVYSPAIAGIALVLYHYGPRGLAGFLRRLTLWRMSAWWWLFLILGIPTVFFIGAAVNGTIGEFPFSPWYEALPALAMALFIGPIEEFGWRGVALPLLQRKYAPIWSALILGVIWAVWHIPSFLIGGLPQSAWSIVPFFAGLIALSVILTPMFNAARGSLLIAALFHFQLNNPLWPDAQPWDSVLLVAIAVAVVILNRRALFDRASGVTEVLMPGERLTADDRPQTADDRPLTADR